MVDFISQNRVPKRDSSFLSMLMGSKCQEVQGGIYGRIFTEKNFAKDWNSIYVHPSELDYGISEKGMRKIVSPTLIMASHCSMMAFVLASEENPVFICSGFKRTQNLGYTLLFRLKPGLCPDYIFYMSKYDSWTSISHSIDEIGGFFGCSWKDVGAVVDDIDLNVITAEDVFYNGRNAIIAQKEVPSVPAQEQRVADAKAMEKMLKEKMSEKERKFKQKEWLNEAHIRNSKHRLSNEVMPIRMSIERLQNFFEKHPDGVNLSDVIGEITNQSVKDLLEDLSCSVKNIEIEIENLTKSEQAGEPEQELNVAHMLSVYFDKIASKYPISFNVEKIGFEKELIIKISPKAFMELLDNIVGNAVRHGFIGNRNDYLLQVSIDVTDNRMCEIAIANNGEPMSERARETFFEQGSFAGQTGHTGIGGYRIYDICDKAGGKVMNPYSKQGFPVVICVKFPLV